MKGQYLVLHIPRDKKPQKRARNNKMIILFNKYHTWRDRTTSVSSHVMSSLHQRYISSLLLYFFYFGYGVMSVVHLPLLSLPSWFLSWPAVCACFQSQYTVHWQVCLRVACVPCVSLRPLRISASPAYPCVSLRVPAYACVCLRAPAYACVPLHPLRLLC